MFDTADEKGMAYSIGYVTGDVVASVLVDKGIGKLGALGKAEKVAAEGVAKYSEEVAEVAGKAGKHADDVAKAAKETVERAEGVGKAAQETASDSGSSIVFKYEHNPSDNPKVLQDVMENQNAVYGYSPSPNSESIGGYVEAIDWSNPTEVAKATARREAYHIKNDNISELVIKMKNDGYSVEEIARAANQQRNLNSVC